MPNETVRAGTFAFALALIALVLASIALGMVLAGFG
jgi:hypothetical protein